jgi:hypothetical protein
LLDGEDWYDFLLSQSYRPDDITWLAETPNMKGVKGIPTRDAIMNAF